MIDAGARVQELCDLFDWDIAKLSKAANLSRSTVQRIISRKSMPSLDTVNKICQAFKVPLCVFSIKIRLIQIWLMKNDFFHAILSINDESKKRLQAIMDAALEQELSGKIEL